MYFLKHVPGANYFLGTYDDELISINVEETSSINIKHDIPENNISKEKRYKTFIAAIDEQDFEKMEECYNEAEKYGSIYHLMGGINIEDSPIYHFTCLKYQSRFQPLLEWFYEKKLLNKSLNLAISRYYASKEDNIVATIRETLIIGAISQLTEKKTYKIKALEERNCSENDSSDEFEKTDKLMKKLGVFR